MIDKEKCKEKIKRFNNYILCFVLFYTGVAASSLFNMLKASGEGKNWLDWEGNQDLDKMKKMY